MVVKDKSRPIDGEDVYKHSGHFIVEVAGVPTTQLAHVCHTVFKPYLELLNQCKLAKSFAPLDDKQILGEFIGFDPQTMHGKSPFATLFSKKGPSDPPSQLQRRAIYRNGERESHQTFKPTDPHDVLALPPQKALRLLKQACFTIPKAYMCALSPKARNESEAQQIRTAAKSRHATSGGGAPLPPGAAPGVSHLPEWLGSVLWDCSKRVAAAIKYHENLKGYDPQLASWTVVHVDRGGLPCPAALCNKTPVIRRHGSNGVILAYDPTNPQYVYMRCTGCKCVDCHEEVEQLKDAEGRNTAWVKLSKATLDLLTQLATPGASCVLL